MNTGLDGGMAYFRINDKSSEDRTAESFLDTLLLRTVCITLHSDVTSNYLKTLKHGKKEFVFYPVLPSFRRPCLGCFQASPVCPSGKNNV